MARTPFVFLLIGLSGCNAGENDLTGTIAFETPAECRFKSTTLHILGAMVGRDEASGAPRQAEPVEVAEIGALQPSFVGPDRDGMVHAHLPLNGRWHGLTILGLGQGFVPNSGVSYNRILFAEPPSEAREQLNRMGFDLPPVGQTREFGDGLTEYISIHRHGSGSALECST
jgi:hypothetical protein